MRKKKLMMAKAIADWQPTDVLERRDGRLFVVDTTGIYAPIEVQDDEARGLEVFMENTRVTTCLDTIGQRASAVVNTPYLTDAAKLARLELLAARFAELSGGARFAMCNCPKCS